jgi:IclR family transcriptional regulator, KDG regulon repressor
MSSMVGAGEPRTTKRPSRSRRVDGEFDAPRIAGSEGRARGVGESSFEPEPDGDAEGNAARSTTGDLLMVIEELSKFDRIGVTRLGRHLGLPLPTTYRMLRVLQRNGYVEQLRDSKEYRLTLKVFEIGCQVASRTTMRDVAALEIERLSSQSGLEANLGVLIDDQVLYLAKVETDELLTLNLRPGSRVPATCTAMGKAMLAFEVRPFRDIVGDGPYPARTEHSVTSAEALTTELSEVQRKGYAVDRQELSLGLWCVSAPILGTAHAQQGAVSVASYGGRMEEKELQRLGQLVIACASRVARRIGGLSDLHSWVPSARVSYPRP